jgi:hypothetical protein
VGKETKHLSLTDHPVGIAEKERTGTLFIGVDETGGTPGVPTLSIIFFSTFNTFNPRTQNSSSNPFFY